MKKPRVEPDLYVNHKGFWSLNVMAVCDDSMIFTYYKNWCVWQRTRLKGVEVQQPHKATQESTSWPVHPWEVPSYPLGLVTIGNAKIIIYLLRRSCVSTLKRLLTAYVNPEKQEEHDFNYCQKTAVSGLRMLLAV